MDFDEMRKIWDTQKQEPLYAINEAALHRSIRSRKQRAVRLNNTNDIGLIAVGIVTAVMYSFTSIITEIPSVYDYLIVIALLSITIFIWVSRIRRKKRERTFARTILGDLDHAISSVEYEVKRSKNMVWWFILPLMILVFLNMSQEDVSVWKWGGAAVAFVLSALLVRWDHSRHQIPKKRKLEALREKLAEEAELDTVK